MSAYKIYGTNMMVQKITLCIALFFIAKIEAAELIGFSYNRPLQLYALLESLQTYVTGLSTTHIIYRADNQDFESGYEQVKKDFPSVNFIRQSILHPRSDFKQHTLSLVYTAKAEYLLFAVDDIIVKDYVDLNLCTDLLEKYDAYAFYLRLGEHIDYCYAVNSYQGVPPLTKYPDHVRSWDFSDGLHDWNYPQTVDMTVYRKSDLIAMLTDLHFNTPNIFEGQWAAHRPALKKKGLCFEAAKIVNLPLNSVQPDWENRNMRFATAEEFLLLFNQGLKIDIQPLFRIDNRSAHMEYQPFYIRR